MRVGVLHTDTYNTDAKGIVCMSQLEILTGVGEPENDSPQCLNAM